MSFGEHGEDFYLHGGARPYEYLSRVPLVLSLAAESQATELHGRYEQAVLLTDVFPTLLDLALGRSVASRFEGGRGESLLQRIRSGRFEPLLVSESSLRPYNYRVRPRLAGYAKAVYADNYKLIYCPVPRKAPKDPPLNRRLGDSPPTRGDRSIAEPLALLFDLSRDPMERVDLSTDRPEMVLRLSGFVRDWDCRPSGTSSAADPDWNEDTIETLRSLGYIQ
jgi:arylsulfatase A-like enzyme